MKGHIDELRIASGAMVILSLATALMVVLPYMLAGQAHPVGTALKPYTPQELAGRRQYIANGCVYCHSQQPRDPAQAPDGQRGWGRPSVASDYYHDSPHLLGTMRTGPDLLNIGARQPSRDWQLGHLYQPRAYTPGSTMPAYPFLFEVRHPSAVGKDEVAITLPEAYRPPGGYVVVARQEALDLVAYLLALDRTYPILPPEESAAATASGARP